MAVLVIDNLSPFTPDILACLDRLHVPYVHKKYQEVTQADLDRCSKVILSGRRRNDPAINAANSRAIKQCHDRGVPLLGICYGAEIVALTLGGSIRRMPRSVQSQISISRVKPNPLTGSKSEISVYESHGFCVARLPPGFEGLAGSQYCDYEIFAHKEKKIFGTQFHPEKSGKDGLELIASFTRL